MPLIWFLALAAVSDHNLLRGLAGLGAEALDLLHDVHALNNLNRKRLEQECPSSKSVEH